MPTFFNGTHLIEVTRDENMQDGFRVRVAMADADGNIVGSYSADSTKIYGGNWMRNKREMYAEIIRHFLHERPK